GPSRRGSGRLGPSIRRAWVGPGALLADVDTETQSFAMALPTGINSTTGIAGLTLGGGFGWLTRKYGLTLDNLMAADVVTADGELLRTSLTERSEEHTSELQSRENLVCRLLLEKKN